VGIQRSKTEVTIQDNECNGLSIPMVHFITLSKETCESNYRLIALEVYFQTLEIRGGDKIKIIVKLPTPNKGFYSTRAKEN
jgi:hypothetical protein